MWERGSEGEREIIFPSKLRLPRLDGKSERARQRWAERTRKPCSALLWYAATARRRWGRQAARQADDCDSDHISGAGGHGKERGYFSAFVKNEKVSYVYDSNTVIYLPAGSIPFAVSASTLPSGISSIGFSSTVSFGMESERNVKV